jgi:large subunit ribosomal protein L18
MAVGVKLSGTKTSAKTIGRKRRHIRVRKKVAGTAARPRLLVVVFDRGGNRYHGRVAALAEGAREGGLEF